MNVAKIININYLVGLSLIIFGFYILLYISGTRLCWEVIPMFVIALLIY